MVLGFPGAGEDLAARAARHHALAPDDLAAALLAGTGAGPAPVLLLARLIPAPLAERLPADPRRLPAVRRRLGAWSAQAALSDDTTADLQLMLSEAATNSVEHAYRDGPPGEFVYSVRRRDDGAIRVEVQDFGRWRPPPADPGYRGRGLAVIHNLADEVTLEVGESGTRVTFTVPDDPPPLAQRSAPPARRSGGPPAPDTPDDHGTRRRHRRPPLPLAVTATAEHVVVRVNPAARKLLGDVVGRPIRDALPHPALLAALDAAYHRGEPGAVPLPAPDVVVGCLPVAGRGAAAPRAGRRAARPPPPHRGAAPARRRAGFGGEPAGHRLPGLDHRGAAARGRRVRCLLADRRRGR